MKNHFQLKKLFLRSRTFYSKKINIFLYLQMQEKIHRNIGAIKTIEFRYGKINFKKLFDFMDHI